MDESETALLFIERRGYCYIVDLFLKLSTAIVPLAYLTDESIEESFDDCWDVFRAVLYFTVQVFYSHQLTCCLQCSMHSQTIA